MKTVSTLFAAFIASAAAAPAIVWNGESSSQVHSSEQTGIRSLIGSKTALASVVFVVERDENGSEGLTKLTSSGSLPKVGARYAEASAIHHAVEGMETIEKVAKELGATTTTLDKFGKTAGANKATVNNDGSVSGEITVVKVSNDANPADVDSIVASAIKNANIENVVLTSVRGLSEVKFQRDLLAKQKFYGAKDKSSRRKLEDAAQGNNYYDQDVIAFVNFTPNIFSGLMFFFFFATVTYIGIGCMGAIAGQEVYVTKYPTIGREA
jgi:transposase-like protein